jgi:hypothetical protein
VYDDDFRYWRLLLPKPILSRVGCDPATPAPAPMTALGKLMVASRFGSPIEPMTLANMRMNGVRSLDVSCWNCHHQAVLSADRWPDDVAVPTFGPRMVCTQCGISADFASPMSDRSKAWSWTRRSRS